MELVVAGIALAALAAVFLTLVAPSMERRRRVRNDGSCADDGWTPAMFGSDGGSDCSGADAGGCGGDGGGGGD